MPTEVNISTAKNQFLALIKRVQAGEEIIITKAGKPIVRLVPISKPRVPGGGEGLITMPDDFNAPLPDELLEEFYRPDLL